MLVNQLSPTFTYLKIYSNVSFKLYPMYFCPSALLSLGTARFRRFLVEHAPFQAVQDMKGIVDTMYKTSVEILESKKRALEEGDEATERQVAKGKDILSILRQCSLFWRKRLVLLTFWGSA